MSLYKSIQSFSDYLVSIRRMEQYLTFDLKLPSKWGIPKSIADEGKMVPFETNDEKYKGFSFPCSFNEIEIDETISKINRTIKINRDKEVKEKLFKETIEKLRGLFEKNDLETLGKLYFDFETDTETLKTDEEDGQISDNIELA